MATWAKQALAQLRQFEKHSAQLNRNLRTCAVKLVTGKATSFSTSDRGITVAPSPRGERVAVHDQEGGIWQTVSGKKVCDFAGDHVWAMAFSPNGKLLATGNLDKDVRVFEAATGKEIRRLTGDGATKAILFSHDGKLVAAGSRKGAVRLWHVKTGKPAYRFDDFQREVHALAFSHHNEMFASGHADGTIRLWNLKMGKQVHPRQAHRGTVKALALTRDARILYSTGQDGLVGIWNLARAEKTGDLASGRLFGGHLALSPDESHIVVGGSRSDHDRTVRLWDIAAEKELWSAPESVPWTLSFTFSPDGKIIAAGLSSDEVVLRDVKDGKAKGAIHFESPWPDVTASPSTRIVEFSPDGRLLAAGGISGIRVWEVDSRKHLYFLSASKTLIYPSVSDLVFSPDGRLLVSAEEDGLHLWEVATGTRAMTIPERPWQARVVRISNDGRFLALGTRDGEVVIIEVRSQRRVAVFKGHRGAVASLAFFPNMPRLASGSADTTILIWDLREVTAKPAATIMLSEEQLERAWRDLASAHAAPAYQAMWLLL